MSEIIEVQGLKKHYGPIEAVRGIDFTVRRGELFAFLGQNGAGKSTTISMLTTQIAPDGGRALVHRPEILFLDEPTTGLDPQTRKAVWETVRALQREGGMTVFLTTHYMEEAAQADAVTVIGDGAVLEQGTPGELKARYGRDKLYLSPRDAGALEGVLRQMGLAYTKPRRRYHLALGSTLEAIPILERCRDLLDGAELIGGTMDDVFLQIIEGGEQPC